MGRIIVKIGTNTLTDDKGKVDEDYISDVAKQISKLKDQVVIVSSGAIGAGSTETGRDKKARDIETRQALAAIGQGLVMKTWHDAFSKYDIKVAQILITYDDFSNRTRYLNLKNALEKLLSMDVVPILNENDPISVNEIGESFGDNDKLSALVASKLGAEKLILLSDIDGFYDKDPKKFKDASKIDIVEEVNEDIEKMCGKNGSTFSIGGMESKVNAIKIAAASGVSVVVCDGREKEVLKKISGNKIVGTLFKPHKTLNQKKQWIKEAKSFGAIYIDSGAAEALKKGKNLLPAGIVKLEGNFDCESVVNIYCDIDLFAKAIVDYSSEALHNMIGKKSSEIGNGASNIIKRENLVIL